MSESLFWLWDCFYCPLHHRQESQRLFSVHRLAILQSGGHLFTVFPFLGKDRTSPLLVKPYYYLFHVVSRSKQACSSFWVYTTHFKMYWPGIMTILSGEIRGLKSLYKVSSWQMTFVTFSGLNNDITNGITQTQTFAKAVIYFYEVKLMKMIWCINIELLVVFSLKYFICIRNIIPAAPSALLKPWWWVHYCVCTDHFFRHQIVAVCT